MGAGPTQRTVRIAIGVFIGYTIVAFHQKLVFLDLGRDAPEEIVFPVSGMPMFSRVPDPKKALRKRIETLRTQDE